MSINFNQRQLLSLGTDVPLFEGATARFRLLSIRHWPDLVQSVYAVERAD